MQKLQGYSNQVQQDDLILKKQQYLSKLSEYEAKLALLQQQKLAKTIVADASGTIESVNLEVGDMVTLGQSIAVLKQNLAPAVSVQVNAEEALKLHIGMEAKVYSAILDRHFKGYVTDIGVAAFDQAYSTSQELRSPNTLVKIELKDQNIRLPENSRLKVWLKQFSV